VEYKEADHKRGEIKMMSNISQIKRKARMEKVKSYFGIFLAYAISICALIVIGLLSLSALSQSF
jgi:hypothetical protein